MAWKIRGTRRTGPVVGMLWLVALAGVTAGVVLPRASAVIGGRTVTPGDGFGAFVVQVQGQAFCTGSLIDPQWVVTAGHCLGTAAVVRAGSLTFNQGGQVVAIDQAVPGLDDLGLLHLAEPVVDITPISIAAESPAPGTQARLMGWGQTSNVIRAPAQQLQTLTVPIVAANTCGPFGIDAAREICIGASNIATPCFGDSGGPLIVNGALVGATSRGGRMCGDLGAAVYEDVTASRDFIANVVNGGQPAANAAGAASAGAASAGAASAGAASAGAASAGAASVTDA